MFKRFADKQTIEILSKENTRLLRENTRLRENLNELDQYKEQYNNLISHLKDLSNEYNIVLEEINGIKNNYKKELDEIINKTNKIN